MSLTFGGEEFGIDSQDLVQVSLFLEGNHAHEGRGGEVGTGSGWCIAKITESGQGTSSPLALERRSLTEPKRVDDLWILGDVFLHNVRFLGVFLETELIPV